MQENESGKQKTIGKTISLIENKRTCFNTIPEQGYTDNGHWISLSDYLKNFFMVFNLTSVQQASHGFLDA